MINIIWNITRKCPWSCSFCCVNAIYQKTQSREFIGELTFKEKLKFILTLKRGEYSIDFSGGEIFINPDNIEIVKQAGLHLGKENIGISLSGAFLTEEIIKELANYINDVEFTMDTIPETIYKYRQQEYHITSDKAIKLFKKYGVKVGIQTVLTKENTNLKNFVELDNYVVKNNIDVWSLLKFFPNGRGKNFNNLILDKNELELIIEKVLKISDGKEYKLDVQYMLPKTSKENTCRAVKKSIGILPTGEVVACFWALNENMEPIDKLYSLGNIKFQTIEDILNSTNSKYWKEQKSCLLYYEEDIE